MKTYQVTLPDEFAAAVDRLVAAGTFDSVDHLVLYAVAQVDQEIDREEGTDQEWLKQQIQIGIDQLDRGELLDGPTVMARLRARLREAQPIIVTASSEACPPPATSR
jgi:Arc/MetJ-type ribon-helix-helix transcriptional regulator